MPDLPWLFAPHVFLDTSFAIALSSASDTHHAAAVRLSERIAHNGVRLVTTRVVLLEIGNALARLRYRAGAVSLLSALETDPAVTLIPMTDALYARAFALYAARPDKEWGLIDCCSCVVMQDNGLTDVLTADAHFAQMGCARFCRWDDTRLAPPRDTCGGFFCAAC